MSGALQAVFQNHRSFTIPLPADIGAAFGGGFFAGQISTSGNGTADYNLVVGPVASAQNTSLQFKTEDSGTDPSSVIDGPTKLVPAQWIIASGCFCIIQLSATSDAKS